MIKARLFSHSYSFHLPLLSIVAGLGLLFSGCNEPLYWAKPNAQPGEFERDRVACQEALGLSTGGTEGKGFAILDPKVGTASEAIEQCLSDKGWFLARKPAH